MHALHPGAVWYLPWVTHDSEPAVAGAQGERFVQIVYATPQDLPGTACRHRAIETWSCPVGEATWPTGVQTLCELRNRVRRDKTCGSKILPSATTHQCLFLLGALPDDVHPARHGTHRLDLGNPGRVVVGASRARTEPEFQGWHRLRAHSIRGLH